MTQPTRTGTLRFRQNSAVTVAAVLAVIGGVSLAKWAVYLLPLLLIPLVVAVWGWLAWVRPSFPRIGTTLPTWAWPALAAVAVIFGVLRNVPVGALPTLAP